MRGGKGVKGSRDWIKVKLFCWFLRKKTTNHSRVFHVSIINYSRAFYFSIITWNLELAFVVLHYANFTALQLLSSC